MKNYVKPSIELNKFDVEDIITTSNIMGTTADLTADGAAIYNKFIDDTGATEAANVVEFMW